MNRRSTGSINTTYWSRFLIASILIVAAVNGGWSQMPSPVSSLNSPADDYATAFRLAPGDLQIWVTSGRGGNGRDRRTYVGQLASSNELRAEKLVPSEINSGRSEEGLVALDGCPTFSLCNPDYGMFASNRPFSGRNMDNDLYQMERVNGSWKVSRVDQLSSVGWDDTPSLSPDGRFVYFASDRANPGSGRTDIYVSVRKGNGWELPVPLAGVNTSSYSEQTPWAGIDGNLYFSSDRDGDYDVWVIPLDQNSGAPRGEAHPLELEGVNLRGSDEGHPSLSPGGDHLLFSSNRRTGGVRGDFDIYQVSSTGNGGGQFLRLRVLARELEQDRASGAWHDVTRPVQTEVAVGFPDGRRQNVQTGSGGVVIVPLTSSGGATGSNSPVRSLTVRVTPTDRRHLPTYDTLLYTAACTDTLEHTLYLWDTTVYYSQSCRQDFPVSNVRFFVTGYWCPTSQRYADYTPCRSVFPDDSRTTVDACPTDSGSLPEDDLYTYRLHQPYIEQIVQENLCIRWGELESRRNEFATSVDSAVDLFVDNMRSALQAPCVKQGLNRGDTVRVYITGWTDPRDMSPHCLYTGEGIDFDRENIRLQLSDGRFATGRLEHGIGFREYDRSFGIDRITEGNQLLSELRAWYTAQLLDGVWREKIEEYAELADRKQLMIICVGKAINQDNLPFESRRSVDVAVEAANSPRALSSGIAAGASSAGGIVQLCGTICR